MILDNFSTVIACKRKLYKVSDLDEYVKAKLQQLNHDDVSCTYEIFTPKYVTKNNRPEHDLPDVLDNGVDVEVLEPGSEWKKGKLKLKITIEFYPENDETLMTKVLDSPLDDIRQMIVE